MQIAKMNAVPINASPRDVGLFANNPNTLSFSTLMQRIIDDKAVSTQETATKKQTDSLCDCDKSKKPCECDSDKAEVIESKKTGIAACMECPNRTNGQCAMWNDENDDSSFNLFSAISNNTVQANVVQILDIQNHLDVIAKASSDYDYTNAYAYVKKKLMNVSIE